MNLTGKRIFITGGTGLIGGRLAERLAAEEGASVIALARTPEKGRWLLEQGVDVVRGDITGPASLDAVHSCEIVFHTAGWVSEKGTRRQIYAANVDGTNNVVQAALAAKIKRFIHISSCAVYGSLQQFDIDETTPARLTGNRYADSKVLAERIVMSQKDLSFVVARPSQVYGPRSYQFSIRPIELIKAGKMVLVDGGRYLAKPLYIDNLVDGLIKCVKADAAVGQVINFTDGHPVPWREFFGAYGRMVGVNSFPSVPFPVAWLVALLNESGAKLRGKQTSFTRGMVRGLRSCNSFSIKKVHELLAWTPAIDFVEGMQRTEAWLRAAGYI